MWVATAAKEAVLTTVTAPSSSVFRYLEIPSGTVEFAYFKHFIQAESELALKSHSQSKQR